MLQHIRLLATLIVCLLGLTPGVAWGAAVSVSPVRVHLSLERRSELLEIRNSGSEPVRFQAQVQAWHESADGKTSLVPTRDLLFFPSLLEIPAGQARRIRIASTVRPGTLERSYRMILNEFPGPAHPGTVQVLTRLSVPVFVQPATLKPTPVVHSQLEAGHVVIVVANRGNVYLRARSVRVVARSSSGQVVFEQSLAGWYVLAGGQRRYSLDLPPGACAKIATLDTTLHTEKGSARDRSSAQPGAACGI
jgi:fimbrial chaperone protein